MQVDDAAATVGEDDARGPAGAGILVLREAERRETQLRLPELRLVDRQVDVAVRARLLAEQRVDAPAAVDPDAQAAERLENSEDVCSRHPDLFSLPCRLA